MEIDSTNVLIADYVVDKVINEKVYPLAKICLKDALGCAILSLQFPECKRLLGPSFEGTLVPNGSRVPGTAFVLDPVTAAFNLGAMIRWLDFNDTWLGKEWAHPSDNIAAILSIGDYLSQKDPTITMKKILNAIIKAYEIQGTIAISNSFNSIGLDHVILVKVASTAVVTKLLGGSKKQIMDALSHAWIDLGPLRTYRHGPNTGSRKSWAAGDQAARAVYLSMLTMRGEMGYKNVLSAKTWGLFDVLFKGKPFTFEKTLDSFIMENILFKVSYPAEFHAQTAVECAVKISPEIQHRFDEISQIDIETQMSAIRIIDKKGTLNNHADRDHCLQYMVAVALIKGNLTESDYSDQNAANPLIDFLRNKMSVSENSQFTKDYEDLNKRSIATRITVYFQDGSKIGPVTIEYPLGHAKRRQESFPFLEQKFKKNMSSHYPKNKVDLNFDITNDKNPTEQAKLLIKQFNYFADIYGLKSHGFANFDPIFSSNYKIELTNYKDLFNDLSAYLQKAQRLLPFMSQEVMDIPKITDKQRNLIVRYLEEISDHPSENLKDLTITIKINGDQFQVGTLNSQEFSQKTHKFFTELSADFKVQKKEVEKTETKEEEKK